MITSRQYSQHIIFRNREVTSRLSPRFTIRPPSSLICVYIHMRLRVSKRYMGIIGAATSFRIWEVDIQSLTSAIATYSIRIRLDSHFT